ncbi:hypothetical protein ACPCXF_17375 [Lysinibacillus agricola]
MSREQGGKKVIFTYDTEEQLTAVINERGETYQFERDTKGCCEVTEKVQHNIKTIGETEFLSPIVFSFRSISSQEYNKENPTRGGATMISKQETLNYKYFRNIF